MFLMLPTLPIDAVLRKKIKFKYRQFSRRGLFTTIMFTFTPPTRRPTLFLEIDDTLMYDKKTLNRGKSVSGLLSFYELKIVLVCNIYAVFAEQFVTVKKYATCLPINLTRKILYGTSTKKTAPPDTILH